MTLGSVCSYEARLKRNMALSKVTAGPSPGIWLVTVVKSSPDLLLHGQPLEMCSPKDQNTLGTQRGREKPEGFSGRHLVYSGAHRSLRISTKADSAYIGVFKKQKQNFFKD